MRIGSLGNPDLVNTNYRSYQPLAALERRGHSVLRAGRGQALALEDLLRCDVVHVHRMNEAETRAVVRHLQAGGVGVVWDNDDDLAALPRWNPGYRRLGAAGRRDMVAGVSDMVRLVDVVTTPSAVLAAKYRELGSRDVRVIENHLPPAFMDTPPQRHDGVVIGYLASLEHHVDYERTRLREILHALLDEHPDVRVLGIGLGLGLPAERYEHVRLEGFYQLTRTLARADVGIAPLADIPWNRARSNVKLKEYAAAGLPWLASPVGPYLDMGEQQGGRLVADDDWHDALAQLIGDARARRKLAKRAAKWVRREGVDRHAGEWEAALRDAAERARAQARAA